MGDALAIAYRVLKNQVTNYVGRDDKMTNVKKRKFDRVIACPFCGEKRSESIIEKHVNYFCKEYTNIRSRPKICLTQ
jgi:hypothetical protein